MTEAQKKLYHYRWDRFQKRQERIYTVKFKKALHEQARQYAVNSYITSGPIYEVLVDLYKTVGSLWAHQSQVLTKRQEVKARMPMGFNERIIELMREYYGIDLQVDAETITTYTREVIQKVLSDAAMSGASINDIVRELSSNSGLSTMRARRISRTEISNASNGASLLMAKESGIAKRKVWLAVNDKRLRKTHRHVDGQQVELDGFFNLGNGVTMQHPGARVQSSGLPVPGDDTINCRCTHYYEVIE